MYKRVALNGLVALGLLAGSVAQADSQPGFYAGAGVGQVKIKADDEGFDADDTGFKVFGGYSFNEYFAVEAAYFDGGKPDDNVDFGIGTPVNIEADASGFNLSAVGRLPLGEAFSLFAKLGYASYDVKLTARVNNVSFSDKLNDEDLSYGVGAAYNFGQSFQVRAEYEAIDVDGGDFDFISLGGVFKF
jgi:OmpA-OmpF porin, OOP family